MNAQNCFCNPMFDLRCICSPDEDSFKRCPRRDFYIYEVLMRNNIDVYFEIDLRGVENVQSIINKYFALDGLEPPVNIDWGQLMDWWNEDEIENNK